MYSRTRRANKQNCGARSLRRLVQHERTYGGRISLWDREDGEPPHAVLPFRVGAGRNSWPCYIGLKWSSLNRDFLTWLCVVPASTKLQAAFQVRSEVKVVPRGYKNDYVGRSRAYLRTTTSDVVVLIGRSRSYKPGRPLVCPPPSAGRARDAPARDEWLLWPRDASASVS